MFLGKRVEWIFEFTKACYVLLVKLTYQDWFSSACLTASCFDFCFEFKRFQLAAYSDVRNTPSVALAGWSAHASLCTRNHSALETRFLTSRISTFIFLSHCQVYEFKISRVLSLDVLALVWQCEQKVKVGLESRKLENGFPVQEWLRLQREAYRRSINLRRLGVFRLLRTSL